MVDKEISRIAERFAREQREVSVSEFFERNRHLLGYDNPTRALLTVVKELVDNAIDAAEDARILPRIWVMVKPKGPDRFRIVVKDNGPGIVDKQIPLTMGKLLYGSKFFKLVQSRGQQGVGGSGAILYSQLTTGKPTTIVSSIGNGETSFYEIMVDVKKNEPQVVSHHRENDGKIWHGVKIEMEVEGRYVRGKQSIPEYVKQMAIANPYADVTFNGPDGKVKFPRGAMKLPPLPKEIKPHPDGIELGILKRMLRSTRSKSLSSFLRNDFSRIGKTSSQKICKLAGLDLSSNPLELDGKQTEKLLRAMRKVKLLRPPVDCLSPLGENLLVKGLQKEMDAEFFSAVTRPPAVYRGNPFQVEAAIAWGGNLPQDQVVKMMRLSNKVPLLFQSGDCAITKSIAKTDWKRYGLKQSGKGLPIGPAVILVHFSSVWVPFISESKQAIASYSIIIKEMKLALQELGRRLKRHLSGKRRLEMHQRRIRVFEKYIPEVALSLSKLTDRNNEKIEERLQNMVKDRLGVKKIEKKKRSSGKTE